MQLDMNLLLALDVLLDEGSVGGAADRMHVSSPAMSRTLDRIRHMTGDAILVRAGRHMAPTPYADSIRDEVHAVVTRAQAVLARQRKFDALQLDRAFTVQCHDALASGLGISLLETLRTTAPNCRLRVLAEPSTEALDLRRGEVDLHLGAGLPSHSDIRHTQLGEERLVVALRTGHPLAVRRLSVRGYASASHLTVSRRGRMRDKVDDLLDAAGLSRTVVASAPTAAAGLLIASASDLLVVVPKSACAHMVKALKLKTLALPFAVDPVPVIATWHARNDGDPAHVWFRDHVGRAVKAMLAGKPA